MQRKLTSRLVFEVRTEGVKLFCCVGRELKSNKVH